MQASKMYAEFLEAKVSGKVGTPKGTSVIPICETKHEECMLKVWTLGNKAIVSMLFSTSGLRQFV